MSRAAIYDGIRGAEPWHFRSIQRHASSFSNFFEHAICSSLEFCSISYNHLFLQVTRTSAHALYIDFYNPDALISHSLSLSIYIPTLPYRTISPPCQNPKLIMVQPPQKKSFPPRILPPSILPKVTQLLHAPGPSTPLQVPQVLPARRVPRRHVLLHAVCESGLLGRRDGRARVGDRALEAVLVDFL